MLVSAAGLSVEFGVGAIYKQSAGAAAAVQNLLCWGIHLNHQLPIRPFKSFGVGWVAHVIIVSPLSQLDLDLDLGLLWVWA